MHPADEGTATTPSEAALADRLARLAERRHVAERRHRTPTASSDDEGEAGMPPRCSAVQALRELLEGRGAALEGGIKPSIVEAWGTLPPAPTGLGGGEAQEPWAAPLQEEPPPLSQIAQQELQPAPARDVDGGSGGSGAGSAGSSVPPTARLLINVDNGHGREAIAAVRRQHTAELRDADAAVREAEVGGAFGVGLLKVEAEPTGGCWFCFHLPFDGWVGCWAATLCLHLVPLHGAKSQLNLVRSQFHSQHDFGTKSCPGCFPQQSHKAAGTVGAYSQPHNRANSQQRIAHGRVSTSGAGPAR